MTEKLYYEDQYLARFTARATDCREAAGGRWEIKLDRSAFYPEGGGQPGDTGRIGSARVLDTVERGGDILHVADGPVGLGEELDCEVDWQRRFDFMQQHSGEHIVSGLIHSRFGYDNVGFHMGAEVVAIDFNGLIGPEELREIEYEANRAVWRDAEVGIRLLSGEALKAVSYRSKKEIPGEVRLVEFPGYDVCACCGTHVRRTGEIGCIRLLSVQRLREGVRIEMVSGERCYRYFSDVAAANHAVSVALSSPERETPSALERFFDEQRRLKLRAGALEDRLFAEIAARCSGETLLFEPGLSPDSVRRLCDAVMQSTGCRCAVFSGADGEGYKYAVGEPGGDLRQLVRDMNSALSGRGGGKPGFAQGSVAANQGDIEAFFASLIAKETV